MKDATLQATVRSGKAKQVRDAGFIPGVLNDSAANSTSVQFEITPLNKVIAQHGKNAKVWINLDGVETFGYIKVIQRHPVEGKIIHVSVQLVAKDQEVKRQLQIVFHGLEELENRQLHVQIHKYDVEVTGTTELMPDVVVVDVAKKEVGDSITCADFKLPTGIKLLDSEHEVYAVIKAARKVLVEEPVVVKPA